MKDLNKYREVILKCDTDIKEILIAELDLLNFESVMETDDGLHAYISDDNYDKDGLSEVASRYKSKISILSSKLVEETNWNIEWEKNFEPVGIENLCYIRAPFHASRKEEFQHEIIVQPKMSFGTGHHATTWLMAKTQIQSIDHAGKKVMDAGCGTAILAVLAEKLGAQTVVAYDNNDWSVTNAPENVNLNNCERITTLLGTIDSLGLDKNFDIILANINKNVLIEEISMYGEHLLPKGQLLISGFFSSDEEDLRIVAEKAGLKFIASDYKDNWTCSLFKK